MIIKVMASSGHTGGLGTDLDVQVTDGDLGNGVHVHLSKILKTNIIDHVHISEQNGKREGTLFT